jgi:hypothetical protein
MDGPQAELPFFGTMERGQLAGISGLVSRTELPTKLANATEPI